MLATLMVFLPVLLLIEMRWMMWEGFLTTSMSFVGEW